MIYDLSKIPANVRQTIENSPKYRAFFNRFPDTLLQVSSDAKTVKGEKMQYLTGILYLSPSNISGQNVCPMAEKAACAAPCLFTAGRGAMSSVFMARLRKTLFLQQYAADFLALLCRDIARIEKKAKKIGFMPVIRLNGTSDIRFENALIGGKNVMELFPQVMFYDYTKIANRKNLPPNYDLTFSYSGVAGFSEYAKTAIENGLRVAAVFRSRDIVENLINSGVRFLGRDIIDGDASDLRFLEPSNSIVALYAKGRAKIDGSGFVVDIPKEMETIYRIA